MREIRLKSFLPALKIITAALILGYLLYKVPFGGIWDEMGGAKLQFLVLAGVGALLVQWTTADRLKRLLRVSGNKISTWVVFNINLSTLFYGLFLPGGNVTGILIRFYRLSTEKQDPYAVGVALFSDRIISTIALLLVGIVFWLPNQPEEGWLSTLIMTVLLVGLVLTILFFSIVEKIPFVRPVYNLVLRYGGSLALKIQRAIKDQARIPALSGVVIFLLSVLTQLLGVLSYWFIARSLEIDIGFITMGWVRSTIILATMIPLTPSGIGLREGAALLLLTQLGVSEESALAFSLLVFGITILVVGLIGGLFEGRRLVFNRG